MRLITQWKFLIYLYTRIYKLSHICQILVIVKYYICEYIFPKNLNDIYYKDTH